MRFEAHRERCSSRVVQPSFMLTPWAVGTPWYEINLGYWSTPTPTMEGGVYIGNP